MWAKSKRSNSKELMMFGLEKAVINAISSFSSFYVATTAGDQLDAEYLAGAALAGLYHSSRMFDAAGDQLIVSIIAHLISNMTSTSGTNWFMRNVYGTTATTPTGAAP